MDYRLTFTDRSKSSLVVKPYTANGPKDPAAPVPLYAGAVSANSSLIFLGKGAFDYGEPIQQNLLHLLENFANKTRPSYPTQGQLWYKSEDFGDPSYPSDPSRAGLYIYTGTTWVQVVLATVPASANINAGDFRIVNVADAVAPTDAVNLQTADDRYVNVSGDTMTGDLNMSSARVVNLGDATSGGDAVSRNFADARYLQTSGGVMFGSIDMSNTKIINVQDPTSGQDALNLRTADARYIAAGIGGAVDGGTYE